MELNIFPHDAIRRCMFVRCQQKFIYTNCFCQFERVTPISCFLPDPSFTDTSSVKHKPYFHFWDTCWTFKCHFSSVWARVSWGQQWMCDHSVQWSLAAVQLLKVKSACAEASQQWDNTPFKTVSWLYLSWTFDLTLKSQTGTYRYRSVCFFSGEIRNPDGGSLLLWESPLCMCLQVQLVAVQQCSMVTQSSQPSALHTEEVQLIGLLSAADKPRLVICVWLLW